MVKSRKEAATRHGIEPRVGVAAANVHTRASRATLVPLDRRAMSRVLGRDPAPRGQKCRPDLLEANQADANHPHAANDVRPEGSREQRREHSRTASGDIKALRFATDIGDYRAPPLVRDAEDE